MENNMETKMINVPFVPCSRIWGRYEDAAVILDYDGTSSGEEHRGNFTITCCGNTDIYFKVVRETLNAIEWYMGRNGLK